MTENMVQERVLFELFEPILSQADMELVAVEILSVHGRRTVRVSMDSPEGVDVAQCGRVSHALSALLDVKDSISGQYNLEVSSPGLERPLQRSSDFDRFAGYRAHIRLVPGAMERRRYTGTLLGLEEGQVRIESSGHSFEIPVELIEKAHLLLELDELNSLAEPVSPAAVHEGDAP